MRIFDTDKKVQRRRADLVSDHSPFFSKKPGPPEVSCDAGPSGVSCDAGPSGVSCDAGPSGVSCDAGPSGVSCDAGPSGVSRDEAVSSQSSVSSLITQDTNVRIFGPHRRGYQRYLAFHKKIYDQLVSNDGVLLKKILNSLIKLNDIFLSLLYTDFIDMKSTDNPFDIESIIEKYKLKVEDGNAAAANYADLDYECIKEIFEQLNNLELLKNIIAPQTEREFIEGQKKVMVKCIEPPCWRMVSYLNALGYTTLWSNGYKKTNWHSTDDDQIQTCSQLHHIDGVWFIEDGIISLDDDAIMNMFLHPVAAPKSQDDVMFYISDGKPITHQGETTHILLCSYQSYTGDQKNVNFKNDSKSCSLVELGINQVLFNMAWEEPQDVTLSFATLDLAGKIAVFDRVTNDFHNIMLGTLEGNCPSLDIDTDDLSRMTISP